MSELEKAKQIAAEAFNFKSKAYTTIEQQNEIIEVNRKAFMQILSLSSLTIPQSIAEKIGKFIKVLHFLNEFEAIKYLSAMDLNGDRTPQWLKDNPMLVFAYLAGKALGVDLVKVGADE